LQEEHKIDALRLFVDMYTLFVKSLNIFRSNSVFGNLHEKLTGNFHFCSYQSSITPTLYGAKTQHYLFSEETIRRTEENDAL